MKLLLPIVLLACSLLLPAAADHPSLRLSELSDDVEKCFWKCDKDIKKTSKVTQCQGACVTDTIATGRTRSAVLDLDWRGVFYTALSSCNIFRLSENCQHFEQAHMTCCCVVAMRQ